MGGVTAARFSSASGLARLHLNHPDHEWLPDNWRTRCGIFATGRVVTVDRDDIRLCPRCVSFAESDREAA